MKRVLYNPLDLVKKLFGGGGGSSAPAPTPAAQVRETETGAGEEAARKAATQAAQTAGARSSLLTDANLASTFGSTPTRRKSLLGG